MANMLGYQTVWLVAVFSAGRGLWQPGLFAAMTFVSCQLWLSRCRRADGVLLGLALLIGCVTDGVSMTRGWIQYGASQFALPPHGAPLWILALWCAFSQTLNHSLTYVRDRWWLAMLLGAIGGPLAYLSAQRGWEAVIFQVPRWRGLIWLSCTWAFAMLLLSIVGSRYCQAAPLAPPTRSVPV